jgi:hypothetical protein
MGVHDARTPFLMGIISNDPFLMGVANEDLLVDLAGAIKQTSKYGKPRALTRSRLSLLPSLRGDRNPLMNFGLRSTSNHLFPDGTFAG